MRGVRGKVKILVIVSMIGLLGCGPGISIRYSSEIDLDMPIPAKTSIKIRLPEKIPPDVVHESIVQAITSDLVQNVFPNFVEADADILCIVDVMRLNASDEPWGLLWAPLVYLGVPAGKLKGGAAINLRITFPDGTLIKSYQKTSYRENWWGLYSKYLWGGGSGLRIEEVLKETMEKIKKEINQDRNEIIAAIEGKRRPYEETKEITRPSKATMPPRLSFSYSLVDEDKDRIFDGGERVSLKITVKNQGKGTAQGVKVLLSGDSKALSYLGREKYLGEIPPGSVKSAVFAAVLPYQIVPDEGSIVIKVTEERGFGALMIKKLRVAMQPVKVKVETEIISELIDVDQPLSPSSFTRDDAYAVVIGITDYRSAKIPDVKYATRDAEGMRDYLINLCGIPDENITMLTDERATLSDLTAFIEEWLARNVSKNSFVFIYFAGHGTPNPEKGDAYLVPYDGEPGYISKLYPLKRFYNALEKLPSKKIVVALDACFSGAGGRSVIEKGKRPLVPVKISEKTRKVAIITASAANEISQELDEKRHGLFTYYFLKGLRGEADANGDCWITLGELYNYCQPKILQKSKKLGYTQTPKVFPEPLGDKASLRIGKVE